MSNDLHDIKAAARHGHINKLLEVINRIECEQNFSAVLELNDYTTLIKELCIAAQFDRRMVHRNSRKA